MAAPPARREGVKLTAEKSEPIAGGAGLDDSEKMIGSMALVDLRDHTTSARRAARCAP